MKVYDVTPRDWLKGMAVTIVLFMLFQAGALLGQAGARYYTEHQAIDKIQSRISLDLQFLDVGNQALQTPPNQITLKHYLQRLNTILAEQKAGVMLVAIQSVSTDNKPAVENARLTQLTLQNSEQSVSVQLAITPLYHYFSISPLALIAALLISPIFIKVRPGRASMAKAVLNTPPPVEVKQEPTLTINLNDKTIGNGVNDVTVQLQNKPLCFYTAPIALLH